MESPKKMMIERFTSLMEGICTQEFVRRLDAEGYFEAPAGMKHHGAREGGLFRHSLCVAQELYKLTERNGLIWQRQQGPVIVGLLHDLCKVKQYIGIAETRVELFAGEERRTISEMRYEWNKENNLPGHGDASIFRIMEWGGPQLKEDELYCIRYHMGAYQGQQEWQQLDMAIRQYPNILYTHLADMIASKLKGE